MAAAAAAAGGGGWRRRLLRQPGRCYMRWSPLYVVNQGPVYSGPGLMQPYATYSPDTAYAPAADYPYVPGRLWLWPGAGFAAVLLRISTIVRTTLIARRCTDASALLRAGMPTCIITALPRSAVIIRHASDSLIHVKLRRPAMLRAFVF